MNLRAIQKKDVRYAVGLSAGTSGYGIQAALVRLRGTGPDLHVKLVRCDGFPFKPALRARLLGGRFDLREIAVLGFELGELLADAALEMIRAAREEQVEVDFVGLHGHVLAQQPPRGSDACGLLQIGEPAVVAERTGLPVLSDFGHRDMAAGGQGGPIVAYADWALYNRPDRTVACLHLGGVAGITVVTPKLENVLAFEIGPGMLTIDGAVRAVSNGRDEMDEGGDRAARGTVIPEVLEKLLEHRYFERVPPKTAGPATFAHDTFLKEVLEDRRHRAADDVVATVTEVVAESVVRSYKRFIGPQYRIGRVVVCGGGALNAALLQRVQRGLPDIVFRMSDQYHMPLIGCDGVAAAVLANETMLETPADTHKATGVRHPVVLGKITPA